MPSDAPTARASVFRRVLIVDDNPDARESLAILLRAVGHEVAVAADGDSALSEMEAFRPQVVLLDIGLPGMDGFDVARRLRQLAVNEPVVVAALSGYGQNAHRERAREAGCQQYFVKPVDIRELRAFLAAT